MSANSLDSKIPLDVIQEAARLYFELIPSLHVIASSNSGVLFTLVVSPQLADRMAACGASAEDDEVIDEDHAAYNTHQQPQHFIDSPCSSTYLPKCAVTPWEVPTHNAQPPSRKPVSEGPKGCAKPVGRPVGRTPAKLRAAQAVMGKPKSKVAGLHAEPGSGR